jgi:hypothetical protein
MANPFIILPRYIPSGYIPLQLKMIGRKDLANSNIKCFSAKTPPKL